MTRKGTWERVGREFMSWKRVAHMIVVRIHLSQPTSNGMEHMRSKAELYARMHTDNHKILKKCQEMKDSTTKNDGPNKN